MKENKIVIILILFVLIAFAISFINGEKARKEKETAFNNILAAEPIDTVWRGASEEEIPYYTDSGRLIWYGHELIANTSFYLGPKGIIANKSNGMNCQNCHLAGGTVPFGNNFGKVYSTYPQFRPRNDAIETIYERINDCFERSVNGEALDSSMHEMKAIYAYIKWLGAGIPKGDAKGGTSIIKLQYMDKAAEPEAGKIVYINKCASCHGNNGQGLVNATNNGYTYPPLWGEHSYNDGAGLYRLSSFAGFVKNNMPFGTDYHNPQLSDEEAWNIAAFVNTRPRPHKDQSKDYKDIAKKPVDFPFGPYADTFPQNEHKYGPFKPIADAYNK